MMSNINALAESQAGILTDKFCDDCKHYTKEAFVLFINKVGFRSFCKLCKKKNEFNHNKNINTFPSKIEFDKRRVIE